MCSTHGFLQALSYIKNNIDYLFLLVIFPSLPLSLSPFLPLSIGPSLRPSHPPTLVPASLEWTATQHVVKHERARLIQEGMRPFDKVREFQVKSVSSTWCVRVCVYLCTYSLSLSLSLSHTHTHTQTHTHIHPRKPSSLSLSSLLSSSHLLSLSLSFSLSYLLHSFMRCRRSLTEHPKKKPRQPSERCESKQLCETETKERGRAKRNCVTDRSVSYCRDQTS